MTPDEKAAAREIFEGKVEGKTACIHCTGLHDTLAKRQPDQQPCPRVRKIEYHPNGNLAAVEYWGPHDGWDRDIVFPRQVYDDEG
jgi:hypothetical protein